MQTEVMRYYGLARPPVDLGFFVVDTEHQLLACAVQHLQQRIGQRRVEYIRNVWDDQPKQSAASCGLCAVADTIAQLLDRPVHFVRILGAEIPLLVQHTGNRARRQPCRLAHIHNRNLLLAPHDPFLLSQPPQGSM